MSIVSNASPLINLSRIGRLDLLPQLYGELTVPEAVWRKVVLESAGQPGAKEIEAASWIQVQAATNRQLIQALQQALDSGEAEAIALALEIGAEFLLMDERLGREMALHMGVRCIGLIGILVEAKRRGEIGEIQPLLTALRDVAGFWVSEALYQRVLQDAKEFPQGTIE
jgi:predicted nucleic acid-binding protein